MGLIDEITGLMRKGPEAVGKLDSIKINTKSVARGAKDSTFQFPVLISDSAPIDIKMPKGNDNSSEDLPSLIKKFKPYVAIIKVF